MSKVMIGHQKCCQSKKRVQPRSDRLPSMYAPTAHDFSSTGEHTVIQVVERSNAIWLAGGEARNGTSVSGTFPSVSVLSYPSYQDYLWCLTDSLPPLIHRCVLPSTLDGENVKLECIL